MRSPDDLSKWAANKVRVGQSKWLRLSDFGEDLGFSFPLHPPRETDVLANAERVACWVREWSEFAPRPGVEVQRHDFHWRSMGVQCLPTRVQVAGVSALVGLARGSRNWKSLSDRALRLRSDFGGDINPALPTIANRLGELSHSDFGRLVAVVRWLLENPDSGLLVRQLPIPDVDTKWLERHRGLVNPVIRVLTGRDDLGIRKDPQRFRVRILDEAASYPLHDFTASADELAALGLPARWVLICENLTSLLALETLPGVIAIHGQGYDIVELAGVPWVKGARICYWGDLDTHGLRILSLARRAWPQTESILMDEATLEQFWHLRVPEPKPFRSEIGYLTANENAALRQLRKDDSRLEQERIDWGTAWEIIRTKLLS